MNNTNTEQNGISKEAKKRLRWMEHYELFRNARLTCRHFAISPDTFYLWKKRFDPRNLQSLEDDLRTRKPKHNGRERWTMKDFLLVEKLREHNPKIKHSEIQDFLARHNTRISITTIYRIVERVKKLGK